MIWRLRNTDTVTDTMETSPLIDEEANDTGRVDNVSSSKPSSSTSQNSNETPPIDFLPASIQDPTRSRPTFYTPSMMLETMNSTMSTVGGSVELKRKLDDGTLIDAKEGEKKAADLQAKMRQSAEEVLGLKFEEKVIWAGLRRGEIRVVSLTGCRVSDVYERIITRTRRLLTRVI